MRLEQEIKHIVEHKITTLISFASVSLYANIFCLFKMLDTDSEDRFYFFLINILPFETFIFIEGNVFLAKYIHK